MNIGILENDEKIANQLKDIINSKYPHYQVSLWNKEEDLKAAIVEGGIYKILFVSLGKNPVELIDYTARLRDLQENMKLIYLADLGPAIYDAFRARPIYILSKEIDSGKVEDSLELALKELNQSKEKNFTVINKQGIFTIPYTKIYYVESDKRKLNIYGHDGLIKTINLKISDFLKYEHGSFFLQCHKSYAVNLMHISQLEKYDIILQNGMQLPISQSRYMDTRAGYLTYLENE